MNVAGHDTVPYPVFRAALDAGNLTRIRLLAARMPHVGLRDALRICFLLRDQPSYERAAVRWLGRLALENPHVDIEAIRQAAAAIDALPANPDAAVEVLLRICERFRVT